MAASPSRLQPGQRMARAHRRAAESQQWDTRLQPARPPGSCNELLEQQLPPSVMLQQGTGSCVNQMYRDFQHAALCCRQVPAVQRRSHQGRATMATCPAHSTVSPSGAGAAGRLPLVCCAQSAKTILLVPQHLTVHCIAWVLVFLCVLCAAARLSWCTCCPCQARGRQPAPALTSDWPARPGCEPSQAIWFRVVAPAGSTAQRAQPVDLQSAGSQPGPGSYSVGAKATTWLEREVTDAPAPFSTTVERSVRSTQTS